MSSQRGSSLRHLVLLTLALLTPLHAMAQLPHARVYTANGGLTGSISVIDTATNTVTDTIPSSVWPLIVGTNPNGRYFYVFRQTGEFLRHSVATPSTIDLQVDIGAAGMATMVVAPDGKKAYVAQYFNSKIVIVDLDTMTVDGTITAVTGPAFLAVSSDGMLYVTSGAPNLFTKIDLLDNSVVTSVPLADYAGGVALSPDGATAYVATYSNRLYRYSTATMTSDTSVLVGSTPYAVAVSPDGTRAMVIIDGNKTALVYTPTMAGAVTFTTCAETTGVAFAPRGDFAYATCGGADKVALMDLDGSLFATGISVGSEPYTHGNSNVTPAILDLTDGVLEVDGDASLTAAGFQHFVPLFKGVLKFTGDAVITKELSLLGAAAESSIDTNGFHATLAGGVTGDSTAFLSKVGAGTLEVASHRDGRISAAVGTLLMTGTQTGTVFVRNANTILAGNGTVGDIDVFVSATLAPGATPGTGVLHADSLYMDAGTHLQIALNSATPGAYGKLDVSGTADIDDAILSVTTGFTPLGGTVFTILTNATGTFAGLPEGATIVTGSTEYTISYVGGDGNDVTLSVINQPPTLSLFQNQDGTEDSAVSSDFTIGDVDDLEASLVTTVMSSNTTLFPNGSMTVTGTGVNRQLVLTPAPNAHGTATITVRLADTVQFVEQMFNVTIAPVNDDPTIDAIGPQTIAQDSALAPVAFGIADIDDDANGLTITLSSSNQALLPDANLAAGGTGATRTVAATPAAGKFGSTIVTVTVSDGEGSASTTFTLTVEGAPGITYSLAEGATGSFFDTDILLANPNAVAAPVTITFVKADGTPVVETRELAALSRLTLHADQIAGLADTTFWTTVVSEKGLPIAVERTMRWGTAGYGASTERATLGSSAEWLFAEGAQGWFSTFMLLANPQATDNVAHITWLRQDETPLTRDYPIAALSRATVDTSADTELAGRSFGAKVTFDQPVIAERAMYFGSDPVWLGGHAAAGATAASTTWYLAEGATGTFFSTYVLIVNPGTEAADVTRTYYPDGGAPITVTDTLAAGQRMTRNVAFDGAALVNAAFATKVTSTQPVVVERAQYWGVPVWIESHNSVGVTTPLRRWALAEGRVGGADSAQTYILLANFGDDAASVTMTFLRESGTPIVQTVDVPARSRLTVGVTGDPSGLVPELTGESFGTLIESTQNIVVERSLYSNANGVIWAAGTNATATPILH